MLTLEDTSKVVIASAVGERKQLINSISDRRPYLLQEGWQILRRTIRMSTLELEPIPCAESVNGYRLGGYHPVHLDDTFKNGRYKVVHKLGYGAYATVWLVYDTILKRYSCLKILAAKFSESHPEIAVLQHLQQHGTGSGKEYVVDVFDLFKHSGPNGIHQCIVMEVLGPCIPSELPTASNILADTRTVTLDDTGGQLVRQGEIYSLGVAKRMATQIAHGLAYIHKAGIVHGDIHMGNMLFYSPVIASWSSKCDVEMYLGAPYKARVRIWRTGEAPPSSPHVPSYIVCAPHPRKLLDLCIFKTDPTQIHVKICDFSEAFIPSIHLNPPPRNTPNVYASPELLFHDPTGPPADIWAFAVLLHNIMSCDFLFESYHGIREEVLRAMVLTLGKFPDKWWYKFEERGEYFTEDGEWIGDSTDMYPGFDKLVDINEDMDEAEFAAYERLIRRMVTYDPEERASIDEVIEWMNQNGWVC